MPAPIFCAPSADTVESIEDGTRKRKLIIFSTIPTAAAVSSPRLFAIIVIITVGFGIMISIIIQFIAGPVVGLFTENAKVIVLGSQYIRGYIFDCIFAGVHFSFSGYFCACGHSEISFIHNIIAILLVRIPGVYITAKVFSSLFPMGLATVGGSLLSVMICVIAYAWMKKKQGCMD